jgi:hydroxyacylglutathione hydrolase
MIKEINKEIICFNFKLFSSRVYLIKRKKENILIDTGSIFARKELKKNLKKLKLIPEKINKIILTHKHFDHTGNISLFKNAKIYCNKIDFKKKNIIDIKKLKDKEFKIIKTPGHTKGSICILYKDILFSGDTLFNRGVGRTDLPGGNQSELKKSLQKLSKLKYSILCPGHLY